MSLNRSRKVMLLSSLFGMLICSITFAADPPPPVQAEVAHLLAYIENSGCQFYRNGTWYDAHQARAHLELKYRYVCGKGSVSSTEDVIELVGSRSSLSGRAYQIKCGDSALVPSGEWLKEELQRFRSQDKKPS